MAAANELAALIASENNVAAGIGQCVQTLVGIMTGPPVGPIMIEFGERTIALGRKRMSSMSGRNAFLYLKSKFGLLNATTPLYLQATFAGHEKYAEVDMDAWEELVPYILRLRIVT